MKRTDDEVRKLGEKIKDIHIAMLTTVEADGSLHSRPMATQKVEFDGDLWFFTKLRSQKVDELQQNRHANVSYVDPSSNLYISVSGVAEVVRDRAKVDELWNSLYKSWFPLGKDDPDLALLRIDVQRAEYWDSPSSVAVHLFGIVKSTLSGEEYQGGEHKKIDLDQRLA